MIKPYTCPRCRKHQEKVWIREGHYLTSDHYQKLDGFFEVRCPECDYEFDEDFYESIGVLG